MNEMKLIVKLFFCLALFSVSSADPLFRLPLHWNKSVRHHPDQVGNPFEVVVLDRKSNDSAPFKELLSTYNAHNIYKRDSGIGFTVSGDCRASPSSGDYYDVYNRGSGNCYLRSEDCGASTSSGGDRVRKIHSVYNAISGNFHITYCSASTSGEKLLHSVYNQGSGSFHITYRSASTSGEELIQNVFNQGSGKVYLKYLNYGGSASRMLSNPNIRRKLVHNLRNGGSGAVYITGRNCDASSSSGGKLAHEVNIAGSGAVYLTNCCASRSSDCRELVDNLIKTGSGACHASNGNDPRCQEM